VSRQINPTPFGTHRAALGPATLLRLRSIPFTSFVCFWPLRFREDQKQPKPAEGEQKMKLEDIKSKTKDAVDYLVYSLESGQSAVLTQYLGAMARFHTYSLGNVMLIARQRAGT
jgi:hypothetical protein